MIFDPFGDFAERGYLRNLLGERDLEKVKILEHFAFQDNLEAAFKNLGAADDLAYQHVLDTHQILFRSLYPWAGQDRMLTSPNLAVSKGDVLFAHPREARTAVEYALQQGQDQEFMASKPGEVMGYLAYGHPFLDGNGRTIMVVHAVLAQRAGLSIEWSRSRKSDYLAALTKELEQPGKGHLDAYLEAFRQDAVGSLQLSKHVSGAKGLDGSPDSAAENQVLGTLDNPQLQEQYRAQREERAKSDPKYRAHPL